MPSALNGTTFIPFNSLRFYGEVQADGQQARVAAIAMHPDGIALLNLVGPATTLGAVAGGVLSSKKDKRPIIFKPSEDVEWFAERVVKGLSASYKFYPEAAAKKKKQKNASGEAEQARRHHNPTRFNPNRPNRQAQAQAMPGALRGTSEYNMVMMTQSANVDDLLNRVPSFSTPAAEKKPDAPKTEDSGPKPCTVPSLGYNRFVLGNHHEVAPALTTFQAHLMALRIPVLYRGELGHIWAEQFWQCGIEAGLLTETPALGVRCWTIDGKMPQWLNMLRDGLTHGWLPWQATSTECQEQAVMLTQTENNTRSVLELPSHPKCEALVEHSWTTTLMA